MRTLFLDFETYYDKDCNLRKINTIQYVQHPDFKVWGVGLQWEDEEEPRWISGTEIKNTFDTIPWESVNVVCHNVNFDGFVLTEHYGIREIASLSCTASMSRALWPNNRASLEALCHRLFGNEELSKGDQLGQLKGVKDPTKAQEKVLADYCKQDVKIMKAAYEAIVDRVPDSEKYLIDLTARMFITPLLVADKKRLKRHKNKERHDSDAKIEASGVPRIVLSSNKQFAELLEERGYDVPTKISPTTKKSIPALGQKDFGYQKLVAANSDESKLWAARAAAKSRIAETRAQRFLEAVLPSGRIPMPLKYYGAHTGRFSGNEQMNVQNMPRGGELRKSLCSKEGQLVYVIDLSQIEARMLAWLAGEDKLLRVFREKGDVYRDFGTIIYERDDPDDITKDERFVAKTAILGLGYGLGAERFYEMMNIGAMGPPVEMSRDEAQKIVTTYRTTYTGIPAFWRRCKDLIYAMCDHNRWGEKYGPLTIEREKLIMPNGLALHYPGLMDSHGNSYLSANGARIKIYGGKLAENITQALSRLVITDAMIRTNEYLAPFGGRVVLSVHDENVAVGPAENPDVHMAEIKRLTLIVPDWCPDIPLESDEGYAKEYSK